MAYPQIHTHASGAFGFFSNAHLIETANGIVGVDATFTRSESRAVRAKVDSIGKPLPAILVTHPHPDHIAGLTELVGQTGVPIVALAAVADAMHQREAYVQSVAPERFGDQYATEWPGPFTYPTQLLQDRQSVTFDGLTYRVHDMGTGGDTSVNSIWVLEASPKVAFVGDLAYSGTHVWTQEDHVLAWLANLEIAKQLLHDVATIYPGHGAPAGLDLLETQSRYLLAYCAAVKELAHGQPTLTPEAKQELTRRMLVILPSDHLAFMIAEGADAVAAELAGAA